MHHLYDGNPGYSQEATLVQRVNPAIWQLLRDKALLILKNYTYDEEAIEILQNLPLELWSAENGFEDHFSVLYMKLPVVDFVRLAREAEGETAKGNYRAIASAFKQIGENLRFITVDYVEASGLDVETPALKSTSVAVELALENLNALLQHSSQGATSAVDRVHTALHAHLLHLCILAGESPDVNSGLEALFGLLRKHHPNPSNQIDNVLRGLSRILGALNPLRNDHSLAHPSADLLDEPEAMLVLNAGRSILRYVDTRFSDCGITRR